MNGKQQRCMVYAKWQGMLQRCYDEKLKLKSPTYRDCTVCDEWLIFSNFKAWMDNQDWKGKELDKDLLFAGNKIYSPETCCFIRREANNFIREVSATRGDYPIGVSFNKERGKFKASCADPINKKKKHIGYFTCPNEAHLAWKKFKHQMSCVLAGMESDKRAVKALMTRYSSDQCK